MTYSDRVKKLADKFRGGTFSARDYEERIRKFRGEIGAIFHEVITTKDYDRVELITRSYFPCPSIKTEVIK